ncbi:hypothetical protein TIFTF001_004195 [Ficus carica]|uniref:Uncharacterized protein n=1 Tax=Ficus carica TaxID=3494 RepID=A0AA87ZWY0_FICCA|nr:hypothetical protein TIFTF001_004195 [Ficus carica]
MRVMMAVNALEGLASLGINGNRVVGWIIWEEGRRAFLSWTDSKKSVLQLELREAFSSL